MKTMELKNGCIYLDGELVECLKSYKVSSSAKKRGIAELEMVMDVKVVSNYQVESE